MVGEQGGRERKEEKLLAILTLALLLSNVDWGRVLASNTLEALLSLVSTGLIYSAFMLIVLEGLEIDFHTIDGTVLILTGESMWLLTLFKFMVSNLTQLLSDALLIILITMLSMTLGYIEWRFVISKVQGRMLVFKVRNVIITMSDKGYITMRVLLPLVALVLKLMMGK